MKFKDKKEKVTAQEILKEGAKTKFWQLVVEALKESKEALQSSQDNDPSLRLLPADQYKMESELYRAKREFLQQLIDTPANIISWLNDPKSDNKNFDPYDE